MKIRYSFIQLICIVFVLSTVAFAAVTLQYFTARDNANGVLVEWKTGDEGGTSKFEIERSADRPDNFINIDEVTATGNNSYYSYQDNSVDIGNGRNSALYFYRLKCVEPNGNYTYTNHITVTHTVSGIRSTWGSIKAIFR